MMVAMQTFYGICTTCDHAGECNGSTNKANPVLRCEEFSVHKSAPEKGVAGSRAVRKASHVSELPGLCKNCDKREACSYKKPASGIWHCEEYQ